jgi:hypothetical protein
VAGEIASELRGVFCGDHNNVLREDVMGCMRGPEPGDTLTNGLPTAAGDGLLFEQALNRFCWIEQRMLVAVG